MCASLEGVKTRWRNESDLLGGTWTSVLCTATPSTASSYAGRRLSIHVGTRKMVNYA